MPRVTREAEAVWEGTSARGRGALTGASSGAFAALPFSEPARVGAPDGQTSPEELLAAAHAACYAMSLAAELTRAKSPPGRLVVRATVVIDEVEGQGHRIVASELVVRGRAGEADGASFRAAVEAADAGCPFSALVRASGEVSIDAALEEVA